MPLPLVSDRVSAHQCHTCVKLEETSEAKVPSGLFLNRPCLLNSYYVPDLGCWWGNKNQICGFSLGLGWAGLSPEKSRGGVRSTCLVWAKTLRCQVTTSKISPQGGQRMTFLESLPISGIQWMGWGAPIPYKAAPLMTLTRIF